jgi:hypothetical protein
LIRSTAWFWPACGGGKSIPLVWLIGYFALTSGEGFNAVLIRHDLAGLSKLEDLLQGQLPMLMPGSRYLKAKRTWRLIHMDGGEAFAKIQGEDLSHIVAPDRGQPQPAQAVPVQAIAAGPIGSNGMRSPTFRQ